MMSLLVNPSHVSFCIFLLIFAFLSGGGGCCCCCSAFALFDIVGPTSAPQPQEKQTFRSAMFSSSDNDNDKDSKTEKLKGDYNEKEYSYYSWIVPKGVPFGSLDKLQLVEKQQQQQQRKTRKATINDDKKMKKSEEGLLCTISTRAIGLNFADIFCVLGLYTAANQVRGGGGGGGGGGGSDDAVVEEFCPGLEYSGIIVDDPTNTYKKGQRVIGFARFNGYSDIVEVPPHFVYPLPDTWTYGQGSSFLVQALTAWHGLVEIGGMPLLLRNDNDDDKKSKYSGNYATTNTIYTVLIHSAAGGVGLWASEIAARRGAVVIGVIGSSSKAKTFDDRILKLSPKSRTLLRGEESTFGIRLAELLCDIHGISTLELPTTTKKNQQLEYLRNHGYGIDLVMESLGGAYFTDSFESLNKGGSLVTFGSTSYVSPGLSLNKIRLIWRYLTRPKIDPGTLTARNIRLAGFNLIFLTDMPAQLRRELKECIFCLSGGYDINNNNLQEEFLRENDDDTIIPLDTVIPPVIGETFNFRTETIMALECLKGGGTVGKVVLENLENKIS